MLKVTKAYCYEKVRNYEKILFIQSIVENRCIIYMLSTAAGFLNLKVGLPNVLESQGQSLNLLLKTTVSLKNTKMSLKKFGLSRSESISNQLEKRY